MEQVLTNRRKLIDIKPSVFNSLSLEAAREGVSLKRYIENLLEKSCPKKSVASGGISRLIGSAIPKNGNIQSIDDDRFQYLLSK